MKERDGRKAITMLSSRNSPIIARKAIYKALEIGDVCCLHALGGEKKSQQQKKKPKNPNVFSKEGKG